MYEHRRTPVLPLATFIRRMIRHGVLAGIIAGLSLLIGIVGFHICENWSWLDSLLSASMLLSGMGPTQIPSTVAGKLFASGYAMFSGVVFLSVAAVLLAPFVHRILHSVNADVKS